MKAIYSPKNNTWSQLEKCIGKAYEFEYAFDTNGEKMFEPVDKNFCSSVPVKESDLNFDIPEKETE